MEDKVELRPLRIVVLELHLATNVAVRARAAGDRKHRVTRVAERALDGDLAGSQERRPRALPGAPDDDADAGSLIGADLVCVGRVEDIVSEREDVADDVVVWVSVGDGVGVRMFDHRDRLASGMVSLALARA